MRFSLLLLPLVSMALSACFGGSEEVTDTGQRGARVGGTDLMREKYAGGFEISTDENGNSQIVSTKGDFLETQGFTEEFDEANLMSTGQAARYEDAEYWGTSQSQWADREARYGSEEFHGSDDLSRWSDDQFAGSDDRAYDSEREYETDAYVDGERIIHEDSHSSLDGQLARQDGRSFGQGDAAVEAPSVPDIIRNLGEGAYVGGEQVRALTN